MKISKDVIHTTENYNAFNSLRGNRNIRERHVRNLVEAIRNKDMELPIIVDAKMNIIDGQHRLEAYKIVGHPIKYIIRDDLKIKDVRMLNSVQAKWSMTEFLMSYCKLGNKEYALLEWFVRTYKLNIKESIAMLNGKHYSDVRMLNTFKDGKFTITHLEQAKTWARRLREINEYFEFSRSQKFIYAMLSCFVNKSFNYKHWIKKLSINSVKLRVQASRNDYIVNIERLYNYNTNPKNRIKLELYQNNQN
tara:strand:+ start:268 stop:1014 length:747 start_codon:yes stop_codon:yes gene_type:complete